MYIIVHTSCIPLLPCIFKPAPGASQFLDQNANEIHWHWPPSGTHRCCPLAGLPLSAETGYGGPRVVPVHLPWNKKCKKKHTVSANRRWPDIRRHVKTISSCQETINKAWSMDSVTGNCSRYWSRRDIPTLDQAKLTKNICHCEDSYTCRNVSSSVNRSSPNTNIVIRNGTPKSIGLSYFLSANGQNWVAFDPPFLNTSIYCQGTLTNNEDWWSKTSHATSPEWPKRSESTTMSAVVLADKEDWRRVWLN